MGVLPGRRAMNGASMWLQPAQRAIPTSTAGWVSWRRSRSGRWAACQVAGSVSGGCALAFTYLPERTSPR
jgi:hypothetical protein